MASSVDTELPHGAAPLTEAQLGMWFAQRMDPSNPIFNIGHCTHIEGPLDIPALQRAVDAALREADALAMRVVEHDGTAWQALDESLRPRLEIVDLRADPSPLETAQHRMRADMHRPVDPTRQAMAAHVLYRLGQDHAVWYQRLHHVAADGYGMGLIDARAARLYAREIGASDDAGEPLAAYAQALEEDAAYRAGEQRTRDAAYWREAYAGHTAAASLSDGAPVSGHGFEQAETRLDAAFAEALQAAQTRTDVSWPDILTALCAAYIARHTGQSEAVVGVPFMGRLGSRTARVPAMVMNVVPLRLSIDEDAPLDALLVEASKGLRKARRHGRYRGEQLRRDLGLLGGNRRLYGPLVNILPFEQPAPLPGTRTRLQVLGAGPVEDLTITLRGNPAQPGMLLTIEANPALYAKATVEAHLARLQVFLQRALAAPVLAHVPTLTDAEHQHWTATVNDTAHPVPLTTLPALIEASIARTPQSVALEDAEGRLTYAAFDEATRSLAGRLQAAGVRRGDVVAVALPRSRDLVIALVAIQRAGAAYLPLDIQHPRERLAGILATATPRAVVATAATRVMLPNDARIVLPQGEDAPFDPDQAPGPSDAAYVLFTSGSTGAPKGVVIEHDAIVNRVLWMQAHYAVDASARILQKTPVTFDVSVWEFFLPLVAGATLVVAPPESHRDPAWLAQLIRVHAVDTLHFVPSMLAAFLAEPAAAGLVLQRVFCSGEELPAALRDRFHATIASELHNLYGPTEAAVDVTWWPASREDTSLPVPIGYPVWNTAMYVLDARGRPLPAGVDGHLFIAGRQLARGYLGRPDLTAERFVPDPFGAPGARMYATGDLARWRDDGALVFLGRSDHQVKIRGQRIELGEIESVLAHAPGVDSVAVIVRTDAPADPRIVAYLVASPAGADEAAVREHAAAHLPSVMVPTALVWLPNLPVTANGKLDRAALPAPDLARAASGRAPAAGTERWIAELFAQVLERHEPLCADDDFFALGGHSLLAARLALTIREARRGEIGLGAIFEHPTVARLAAFLDADADRADAGFGPVLRLRLDADARREPLFCVHPAGGLSWCYGALARAMDPARTVLGLQAQALEATSLRPEPATLDAMAEDYADQLEALHPQGPCHLLGWSVGGIIAHAMAVELQRRGREVGVLAMLDAYPSDCWRDRPEPPPDAVYKALLHIAGHDPASLPDVPLTRDGVIGFLRATGHPLGELPDARLAGVIHAVGHNNRLVRTHHHQHFAGRVLYFRAALDHVGEDLDPAYWAAYAESLDVHDIPSLHAHLTGEAATARIAPIVNAELARRDPGGLT
ncbi:amino acid adenylation domain-containing protein [Achromobacter sp. GG226]|uniref:non-ribosomal peptide synthetase n=1 Tax=Verticiella alkaliphila TaxID=2779529 RepID=UPI001C0C237E|nr:non-ribosomal peptide synthetase [Verticiella sp. GG226]MBU4612319.1 amino acid adenylation domain-containing protein [Verticiella sp. GG226]